MKGADRQSSERCEIRERERREVGREKERRLDGRAEGIDMKCLDVVDYEMHSPNVAVRSVLSDRKERKKKELCIPLPMSRASCTARHGTDSRRESTNERTEGMK